MVVKFTQPGNADRDVWEEVMKSADFYSIISIQREFFHLHLSLSGNLSWNNQFHFGNIITFSGPDHVTDSGH